MMEEIIIKVTDGIIKEAIRATIKVTITKKLLRLFRQLRIIKKTKRL